jgi:chromate transporter
VAAAIRAQAACPPHAAGAVTKALRFSTPFTAAEFLQWCARRSTEQPMPTPPRYMENLWHLLVSFGRVGLFALGGGNGMIKMISDEAVHIRKWFTTDDFGSLLGMTFLFPGLTACKLSGMIGYRVAGIGGLIVAALAINIPGIILTSIGFLFLLNYISVPIVSELLLAMQFAAMALIGAVLFDLIRPAARRRKYWIGIVLTVGFFLAIELFRFKVVYCLLAYLALYVVAPFWTPAQQTARVAAAGGELPGPAAQ